jgi:transcriptional regulator with XRE-family HTH domain
MPSRDPKMLFGKALRAIRTRKGFSQESLAEAAGLHRNMVNFLENGHRNPSMETIVKLAKALRVEPGKFFSKF